MQFKEEEVNEISSALARAGVDPEEVEQATHTTHQVQPYRRLRHSQ